MECWGRALETLPKENLTEGEAKQKEQYEKNLAAAKRSLQDMKDGVNNPSRIVTPAEFFSGLSDQMPGARASEMIPQLTREGRYDSSVRVLSLTHLKNRGSN